VWVEGLQVDNYHVICVSMIGMIGVEGGGSGKMNGNREMGEGESREETY